MINVLLTDPTLLSSIFIIVLLLKTAQYAVCKYFGSLTTKSLSNKPFSEVPAEIDFDDDEAQTVILNKLDDRCIEIQNVIDEDASELSKDCQSISESITVEDVNDEAWSVQPVINGCRAGCLYVEDWKHRKVEDRKHRKWNGHSRLTNGDGDGDLYEDGFMNDRKHGHSLMRLADGRTFEGEYVILQMAKSRMTYQDGSLYEGSGSHEVANMEVTDPYGEKGSYTGSVSLSTGMPHGFGRLEYERAGRWYEGDWKHGQWNGHGRVANGHGDLYEGGLKNDHKHGHGLMRFADGRTFEGEYVNGEMARGRMTYQDGSLYEGSWEEGMPHGVGTCVSTDDSVYEADFDLNSLAANKFVLASKSVESLPREIGFSED